MFIDLLCLRHPSLHSQAAQTLNQASNPESPKCRMYCLRVWVLGLSLGLMGSGARGQMGFRI